MKLTVLVQNTFPSPSRLNMSSKSNLGVLDKRMVPDTFGVGVNMLRNVL